MQYKVPHQLLCSLLALEFREIYTDVMVFRLGATTRLMYGSFDSGVPAHGGYQAQIAMRRSAAIGTAVTAGFSSYTLDTIHRYLNRVALQM